MVENPPVHRGLSWLGSDRHGKDDRELARNTPVPFLPLAQDATEECGSTMNGYASKQKATRAEYTNLRSRERIPLARQTSTYIGGAFE